MEHDQKNMPTLRIINSSEDIERLNRFREFTNYGKSLEVVNYPESSPKIDDFIIAKYSNYLGLFQPNQLQPSLKLPSDKLAFLVVGLPYNGKTFLRQSLVGYGCSVIKHATAEYQGDYKLKKMITLNQVLFEDATKEGRAKKVLPADLRHDYTNEDAVIVSSIMESHIYRSMRDNDISVIEIPFGTATYENDEWRGLKRAEDAIFNLLTGEGQFQALKGKYRVAVLSLTANQLIREYLVGYKELLRGAPALKRAKEIAWEWGRPVPQSIAEWESMIREGAPQVQVDYWNNHNLDLIADLVIEKKLEIPFQEKREFACAHEVKKFLNDFPHFLDRTRGGLYRQIFVEELGVDNDDFYNGYDDPHLEDIIKLSIDKAQETFKLLTDRKVISNTEKAVLMPGEKIT